MKTGIHLLLIAVFFASCGVRPNIQVKQDGHGNISLRFTAQQKYLLLPMEDAGAERPIELFADDISLSQSIIRPADKQIDYWVAIDLSKVRGKKIELRLTGWEGGSLFVQAVKQSDTFDIELDEPHRPVYHFSPPLGWINDPNGMVFHNGVYHLCYQHNPLGTRWQNMSWGHAVSSDLVHWQTQPVALEPDSLGTIFSGSAVVDHQNSAGLQVGDNKTLLAFFTHAEKHGQFQSLAYSNDNGLTWLKYAKNPILRHETARDFRDPKVFWYEPTGRWVMVLAVGQTMEFYSSANAIDWVYESSFGQGHGEHGGVWECPDLFLLPVANHPNQRKWVLICNINPGGPSKGSATQYFVGEFDGKAFTNHSSPLVTKWMDWGKDHYAAVTWSDVPDSDGRRISIAWMSNWEYANDVPTKNFKNSLTLPRELTLVKKGREYVVRSFPVKEIYGLRKETKVFSQLAVESELGIDTLLADNKGAYELELEIKKAGAEIIGFKLFNHKGEYVDVSINLPAGKMYFDRTFSGKTDFNGTFAGMSYAVIDEKKDYRIRILVDKASIELFENEGETAMTNVVFPSEPYNRIAFYAKGGAFNVEKMIVHRLN